MWRNIEGYKENDECDLTLDFLSSCYAAAVISHRFFRWREKPTTLLGLDKDEVASAEQDQYLVIIDAL